MKLEFGIWLKEKLIERNMTQSELAERIGVQPPQISRIISGERSTTIETLQAIAHAMRIPPEQVYRAAGILPPAPEINELIEQIIHETQTLPENDQQEILAFIRMKNNLRKQRIKK